MKRLDGVIAERLREHRTTRGNTQDAVARRAHRIGFAWTQSTVAAIETDRRRLTTDELLCLPPIYAIELPELLAGLQANERVAIGDSGTVRVRALRKTLAGDGGSAAFSDFGSEEIDRLKGALKELPDRLDAQWAEMQLRWPELKKPGDMVDAEDIGDAERNAARKLGVTPEVVGRTAFAVWGRSLVDEREARLEDAGNDARSRQARRGHATRALLDELAPEIEERMRREG